MRSSSISLAVFAACAFMPEQPARADVIDNCLNLLPCYTVVLSTPAGGIFDERELSPVSSSQSGIDPYLMGSGSAFATSGFGHLGAKTEATDTALLGSPLNVISSDAEARFNDRFIWTGPAGMLRFALNLQGSASATGDPMFNLADAVASLNIDSSLLDGGPGAVAVLDAPGSTTGTLVVGGNGDVLDLELSLKSQVFLQQFGHGISDFVDTLTIPRIELLDPSGHFVRDITLTDAAGNVLAGEAPTAVPEPASFGLLGASLAAIGLLRSERRRDRGARKTKNQVTS